MFSNISVFNSFDPSNLFGERNEKGRVWVRVYSGVGWGGGGGRDREGERERERERERVGWTLGLHNVFKYLCRIKQLTHYHRKGLSEFCAE